jgi:hypothetical protein
MRDYRRGFIAYRPGERAAGKRGSDARDWHMRWLGEMIDCLQADDQPFEVRLSDEAFETYELDPPPYTLEVTKNELKKMYYDMVAVR